MNKRDIHALAGRETRETYSALNQAARLAEQEKMWTEAAKYWSNAATFAANLTDERYCQRRAEFCTEQGRREVQHG